MSVMYGSGYRQGEGGGTAEQRTSFIAENRCGKFFSVNFYPFETHVAQATLPALAFPQTGSRSSTDTYVDWRIYPSTEQLQNERRGRKAFKNPLPYFELEAERTSLGRARTATGWLEETESRARAGRQADLAARSLDGGTMHYLRLRIRRGRGRTRGRSSSP